MRSLSSTLTQAQKDQGQVLCKAVVGSYTYNVESTNQLLRVTHPEAPWSQTAKILIDDRDLTLSGLSLEGLTATLSYGFATSAGDEYSATAPLVVKAQEIVTAGGVQQCLLDCYGKPDQMGDDHASTDLSLTSSDTQTVKTLISAIMGATLAAYSHCSAITVTYDSEDSLIDTFKPADYFRISTGDTRKAKVRELLSWTKCVGIFKADGQLHIFSPVVSGTTYDYAYDDTFLSTNHTFFSRVYRNRLVLPNEIVVKSSPDHSPQYTGDATSAASYALLPKTDYKIMRLTSTAQAEAIAAAIIQRLEVDHARGNGYAPMNVGQEVYDYINVTSEAAANSRAGNIGYLTRVWDADKADPFTIGFGFGDILLGGAIGIGQGVGGDGGAQTPQYATYNDLMEIYSTLMENQNAIIEFIKNWDTVPKWHVTDQLIIPVF